MSSEAPNINYDMLAPVTAERDRAQLACEQMGKRIVKMESALLSLIAAFDRGQPPTLEEWDAARNALN